jgi:hypothetical protein
MTHERKRPDVAKRGPTTPDAGADDGRRDDAAAQKARRRIESLIDGAESERVQLDAARRALELADRERDARAPAGIRLIVVYRTPRPRRDDSEQAPDGSAP